MSNSVKMEGILFFCLSSGDNHRYLEDVIRALAMPAGTELQFRYAEWWLDASTIEKVDANTICGEQAIIAYIDQSHSGITPKIVPCRLAVISHVESVGTTKCVTLKLTKFAFPKEIELFQKNIRSISDVEFPT